MKRWAKIDGSWYEVAGIDQDKKNLFYYIDEKNIRFIGLYLIQDNYFGPNKP
jgi:hypothetical protein